MKKIVFIFFPLYFFIQPANAQVKDTDTYIQQLFTALQQQDEKKFIDLYPNSTQLKSILISLMKKQSGSDTSSLALGRAMLNEITDSSLYKDYIKEFREAMDSARIAGVDWSDAKFSFSQADTSKAEDTDGMMLRGVIYFTSRQKDYFISFYEVLWPKILGGWVGASIRNIGKMKYPED